MVLFRTLSPSGMENRWQSLSLQEIYYEVQVRVSPAPQERGLVAPCFISHHLKWAAGTCVVSRGLPQGHGETLMLVLLPVPALPESVLQL